jgi:hypothetical protein
LKGKTIDYWLLGSIGSEIKAGIGFNPGIIIILDQAETPLPLL